MFFFEQTIIFAKKRKVEKHAAEVFDFRSALKVGASLDQSVGHVTLLIKPIN